MSEVFNDYSIQTVELESKIDTVNIWITLLSMVFSILANTGLVLLLFFIITNTIAPDFEINAIAIPIALGIGTGIFVLGVFGGWLWEIIGRIVARSFYVAYLPEMKNNSISKVYRRFIDKDNKIFMEARSRDQRISNFKGIFKLIFRISISELSFYLFITSFIVIPLGGQLEGISSVYSTWREFIDPVIALGISVMVLAFYLPTSFILEDAHMKTFDTESRKLDTPGSTLRSYIDGIVGVGAISSGYSLFGTVRETLSGGAFLVAGDATYLYVIDYILWLAFIMLISWPLIFPAMLFFFLRYQKTVNKFRTDAIKAGIPLGVARIRPPYDEEQETISKYIEAN